MESMNSILHIISGDTAGELLTQSGVAATTLVTAIRLVTMQAKETVCVR